MARTSNFTDSQKAYFYERDRATCVYSGDNLWILDAGASPNFTIDWADHIIPVSGSEPGPSDIDNGVCAGWNHNKKKGASREVPAFLFKSGQLEQSQFDKICNKLRPGLLDDFERFGNVRRSDWYFNRAMFRLLLGVDFLYQNNPSKRRDDYYYAKATRRALKKWQRITSKLAVPTLEDRGLAPANPSLDQQIMLSLRHLNVDGEESIDEIRETMRKLLPIYAAKAAEKHCEQTPIVARIQQASAQA